MKTAMAIATQKGAVIMNNNTNQARMVLTFDEYCHPKFLKDAEQHLNECFSPEKVMGKNGGDILIDCCNVGSIYLKKKKKAYIHIIKYEKSVEKISKRRENER